jgi:predicted site-specific integrase-resolvase
MQTPTPTKNKVELAQPLDSPATFARFAGVTPQCVRNWCHAGIIPLKINAGRIMRFERADALAALEGERLAR